MNGFGGTFCLVLSFLYILSAVVLLGVGAPWGWRNGAPEPERAVLAAGLFLVISVVFGWLPLRLGLRRVASVELYKRGLAGESFTAFRQL